MISDATASGRAHGKAARQDRPKPEGSENASSLQQSAFQAEKRGDIEAALGFWAEYRRTMPDVSPGYVGGVRVLKRARRMDLAVELVGEGLARIPDDIDLLVTAGRLAEATKRAEEADRYWQRVISMVPDSEEYSLAASMCLTCQKKGRRLRMQTVLARLDAHHQRFPHDTRAYRAHIEALRFSRGIKKLAEAFGSAEALSAEWCARFPHDIDLALARVALFEDLERFGDALSEVEALRARVPADPAVEAALIRALSCVGRLADAEEVYSQAVLHFPADRKLMLEYARVASRRSDWHEAERRLVAAQALLPQDNQIARQLEVVRQLLLGSGADAAERESTATSSTETESLDEDAGTAKAVHPEAALMSRFESLGGTIMGCEFGMLQRSMGNDVVSLLRWSETNPPELIRALDCEFEGVGDEANTELRTAKHGIDHDEYVTRDKRFLMASHTFVHTTDAPADRMLQQSCRRLRFLRGKLIEVLKEGGQIFVYRAQSPIDDPMVIAIHAAIARYADNALMCIKKADAQHSPGSMRILQRGVYVGYVNHFRNEPEVTTGSDVPSWLACCRQADAAWQATRAPRQAA